MSFAAAQGRMNRALQAKFGVDAILHPDNDGPDVQHTCIHDFEWVAIETGDGAEQNAKMHTATVNMADFDVPPFAGDGYDIEGVAYTIYDVRDEGSGTWKLLLHRVSP